MKRTDVGRQVTRRYLIGLLATGIAGSYLAACGQPGAQPTAKTAATAPPAAAATTAAAAPTTAPATKAPAAKPDQKYAGTKLAMLLLQGGYKPAVEPAVTKFSQDTGIEVQLIGQEIAALWQKTQLEVSSGSSQVDIYSIDGPPWISTMNEGLEPLSSYIQKEGIDLKDFVPPMLEMGRFPSQYTKHPADYKFGTGELYTMPVRIGVHILHYRKDLFEKYNVQVPKTMTQFEEAAKKLTVETPEGKVFGVLIQGEQSAWIYIQWLDFLWSFGADIFDKDIKKSALTDKKAIEATEFFTGLYKKGYSPPATPTYNMDRAVAALQQGLAAMYPEYSPRALVIDDPKNSKTAGKWAWAPLPYAEGSGLEAGVGALSGWGIGINRKSKNKEAAWQLLKYLSSEEAQLLMARDYANAPTRKSVFNNPAYQQKFPAALQVFKAAEAGRTRAGIPQIAEIEDVLALEVNSVLVGKKASTEAMADATKKIDAILQK